MMPEICQRIQNYWNQRSQDFSTVRCRELASSDAAAWQQYICQFLPPEQRLTVLDAGTGPGFLAILMARLGHRVTGIDSSPDMIDAACCNAAADGVEIEFRLADAQKLPFAAESFDVVISRNLTWNLPDVPAAYAEWQRILRPGGLLLNFDSDYGSVCFTVAAAEEENIHHAVDMALLRECESLKGALTISSKCRPAWDLHCLQRLGFVQCQYAGDIRSEVHISPEMQYDSAAIFCLKASKPVLAKAGH